MNEIANWVLWSIGLVTVAVAAFFGIFWAVSYIAFIVMESRRQKTEIADRFYTVHRWMSGFKDLDILWDYILGNGQIDDVRERYARARGTNVYGQPRPNTD